MQKHIFESLYQKNIIPKALFPCNSPSKQMWQAFGGLSMSAFHQFVRKLNNVPIKNS